MKISSIIRLKCTKTTVKYCHIQFVTFRTETGLWVQGCGRPLFLNGLSRVFFQEYREQMTAEGPRMLSDNRQPWPTATQEKCVTAL